MPDQEQMTVELLRRRPGVIGLTTPPATQNLPQLPPGEPIRTLAQFRRDPLSGLVELFKGALTGEQPGGPSAQGIGALVAAALPVAKGAKVLRRAAPAAEGTLFGRPSATTLTHRGADRATLTRPVGGGRIVYDIDIFDTDYTGGDYPVLSWAMRGEDNPPYGTGNATQMFTEVLDHAKRAGVGYQSEQLLSKESHNLHRRLADLGVNFRQIGAKGWPGYALSPEEVQALDIDALYQATMPRVKVPGGE